MRTKPYEAGHLERYGIAVLAAAVAFALSYVTWPYLNTIPWFFFFTAIMVSAWFGGQGPSVVTTAILVVLGRYFFIRPYHTFTYTTDSLVQTLIFTGVSLFIGFLASARRRAERFERAESRRFQATVMSIADAVIATDAAGRVAFMNGVAERLTGWSATEAKGKRLDEVFAVVKEVEGEPAPGDKGMAAIRTHCFPDEMVLMGRDGSSRPIEANAAPIKDDRGEATGVVLVFRDIWDRKEAEVALAKLYDELKNNDRRKDEFLAMLAHELRNPLAAIGNAVSVTAHDHRQEHVDWSMEIIKRQMKHLTRLIDDLLDVSRISRGKIKLVKDVVEASPILDSAIATVRPLLEQRKQTLAVAIDRGSLWVDADPTRLEQMVVNLLNNAAKFSETGGRIELEARRDGGEVKFFVRDDGVGIRPEQLAGMFDLFVQGDRSLARSEGGLGIGLTIVKKLVEMHGGSVAARSDGPGKGSEFLLRMPAAKRLETATSPEAGPTRKDGRRARILVVDDNVDMARGISMLLKLIGHDVATAHDGPAALDAARQFRPEFVLLDIGLPGMDGYEVASRLRREPYSKDAVIVAVTGYGRDEDRRRSKAAGFDFHLIKPLDHDALLSVLSTAGAGGT